MKSILLLSGLLLASGATFAQGYKVAPKSVPTEVAPDGKMAVPVSPVLPGEEHLSARERVERDLLMPPRRERAAALQAASEEPTAEAKQETPEAAAAEEAPEAPAAHPATHRRHRAVHRRHR